MMTLEDFLAKAGAYQAELKSLAFKLEEENVDESKATLIYLLIPSVNSLIGGCFDHQPTFYGYGSLESLFLPHTNMKYLYKNAATNSI
nr:hypothetical protein [Tanacetum cinerariifolium]